MHLIKAQTSRKMTNENKDNVIYETYYYVGEHIDGCDKHGPNNVYHYISESELNGRNTNTINIWECDLELWPGDRNWLDATRREPIKVKLTKNSL
jgi:hypothetical protein